MNAYREWLIGKIYTKNTDKYRNLLNKLFELPFESHLGRDDDRAEDGLMLRYESPCIYSEELAFRECSVLEMLIALSIRIDEEYVGEPGYPHPEKIFWELISNLGLDLFDDKNFSQTEVFKIVSRWILREFDDNGDGSIFPLRYTTRDQRYVEIWSQMQEYLSENY